MDRIVKDSFKVNHRIYICITIFSILGIIVGSNFSHSRYIVWGDALKNISYGFLASTVVAWLLECYNVKDKNQKTNNIYDAVYSELKFYIEEYIGTWAQICSIAYRKKIDEEIIHTWMGWYELSKILFYQCDETRQKEVMNFFVEQLEYATKNVNDAIHKIVTQKFILRINDVYNDKLNRIIEDYHFEFHAVNLEFQNHNNYEEFWKKMDIINSDIQNYIYNWTDIRFYNYVRFKPHQFFDDEDEVLRAIFEAKNLGNSHDKQNKRDIVFNICKSWRHLILKKWKIGVMILVAIMFPLCIDWFVFANNFPSNIQNESWAGFLGSYIGGICTMMAVFITINDNNKKLNEQRIINEKQEKEQKRLGIRPYLDTRYIYFDQNIIVGENDRVFDIENECTKMVHFDISPNRKRQIEIDNKNEYSRQLYINYIIHNVGAGSAVNMTATVNNFEERLAIAKDEKVQLLCIVTIKDEMPSDLKIKLNFSDVEDRGWYFKEEVIHMEVDKDNELVSKMIKREEQKLVKRDLRENG